MQGNQVNLLGTILWSGERKPTEKFTVRTYFVEIEEVIKVGKENKTFKSSIKCEHLNPNKSSKLIEKGKNVEVSGRLRVKAWKKDPNDKEYQRETIVLVEAIDEFKA